jgi:hypothetical protein
VRVTGLVVVLAAGALAILAASAVGDWPARTVNRDVEIRASSGEVWRALTRLDAYDEWNPFIRAATGSAALGATIELDLYPDGDLRTVEADVLIVRPVRKLRWRSRLLLPGVLDDEREWKLEPVGDRHVIVRYRGRVEGVLAPFRRDDELERGYERMLDALKDRAES